jgi:hypothetical protein
MKSGYRLRDGDQIPTRSTTIEAIMSSPKFQLGVEDARAGRGYPAGYDGWKHTNDRWTYERGRQWAQLAPRSVALKVNGKISEQSLRRLRTTNHEMPTAERNGRQCQPNISK